MGNPLKSSARTAVEAVSTLRRVSSMPMSRDLKSRILRTYLWTFVLKRWDRKQRLASILGRQFRFLDEDALRFLFFEIFINQSYSFDCDKRAPLIIDCGSNIGMSVLYFKTFYPSSRILAFEPEKETFSCLEENVRGGGLSDVHLTRAALSSENGTIDLFYDRETPGSLKMSTIYERQPKDRQSVASARLSDHIVEEVDFLKMDVEGSEMSVIEDLRKQDKLRLIRSMAVEYHHHINKDQDNLSTMLGILEEAGFGYQIECHVRRPLPSREFQDVLIYAYRKNGAAG